MVLLFAFFALPVIASYTTYYIIKPEGRTNYGELIEPQRSLQELEVVPSEAGASPKTTLSRHAPTKGKWLMLTLGPANCDLACSERLYKVRQVRKTAGKEMDRVERVWLMTDAQMPEAKVLAEYEGQHLLRVEAKTVEALFPKSTGADLSAHIYIVDPLGNLMLRFPANADPSKMKKDLSKLLRASRMG